MHPASFFIEKKEEKNHSEQRLTSCHDNSPYPITRGKNLCVAVTHTGALCRPWFEGRSKILFTAQRLTYTHMHRQTARKQSIHFTTKKTFKQLCRHILCRCEPPENTVTHNCMWCYSFYVRYPD